jgi:hypothetical protein
MNALNCDSIVCVYLKNGITTDTNKVQFLSVVNFKGIAFVSNTHYWANNCIQTREGGFRVAAEFVGS